MKKKEVEKKLSDQQIKKLSTEECYKHYSGTIDTDIRDKIETRVFHLLKTFNLDQCERYRHSFGGLISQKISDRRKKIGQEIRTKILCEEYRKQKSFGMLKKEEEE